MEKVPCTLRFISHAMKQKEEQPVAKLQLECSNRCFLSSTSYWL